MTKFEFEAIGTHWQIDITKELSSAQEAFLLEKIKNRINDFDLVYSRFRSDSLVTQISKKTGDYIFPSDADKMISVYKKVYDLTSGLVTPLIGDLISSAGYDANYSMKEGDLIKPKSWEDVLEWSNPKLKVKENVILDFGAGGKGYLVDIVSELLESEGVDSYCVDAGGDIRYRSYNSKELKVGLENPTNTKQVIGVVKLLDQSVCGSAGNRRAWGRFHHIINPEKMESPKNILAVWVVASDTLTSDILTTALYFAPAKELQKNFDFEYFILKEDFTFEKSENFPAEFFTQ